METVEFLKNVAFSKWKLSNYYLGSNNMEHHRQTQVEHLHYEFFPLFLIFTISELRFNAGLISPYNSCRKCDYFLKKQFLCLAE